VTTSPPVVNGGVATKDPATTTHARARMGGLVRTVTSHQGVLFYPPGVTPGAETGACLAP